MSACMCEWPRECGGTGLLDCYGCGGGFCLCVCGGETECPGCDYCADGLDDGGGWNDAPEEEPRG